VKKLKVQKKPPQFLTLPQLGQVLEECESLHIYTFIVLGAFTGLRKGEMERLTWDDVDYDRGEITVRQAKNHNFRIVPMNALVRDALKRHPRHLHSPAILASPKGTPYKDLRKGFEKALAKAGLPRIRIHDLRHSFASNLVATGSSLVAVKELLGHKDIQSTMIYAHLSPNYSQSAVDKLVAFGQDMVNAQISDQKRSQA
jgi:integrase